MWKVPQYCPEYISHHIGVFGITGSGKSYLTRYQIIPLLRNAGYDVMIFDWKGSDYAPYYKDVVNMGDIQLDEQSVYSYLAEKLKGLVGAIRAIPFSDIWRKLSRKAHGEVKP
jgi:DNA helicase HerA-like ATPase